MTTLIFGLPSHQNISLGHLMVHVLLDDEGTIFEICYTMDISKSFASSHPYKQGNLFPLIKLLCMIFL
jgi:hypothetical protein